MKTAIILHGMPSKEEYFGEGGSDQSKKHWLLWLQNQLIASNIPTQAPELPEPYEPVYEKWSAVFDQLNVDKETMLVGHSCGAGFLIRWLSENKIKVGKVALIAPFLDPNHDEVSSDFFNFVIDSDIGGRTDGISIFYSEDDDQEILTSVKQIQETVSDVETKQFTDRGHFVLDSMETEEFPELLEWLLL